MGTRREDFIVLGARIPKFNFDDSMYDEHEQYFTKKTGDIAYLYDGMNGQYFIVGKILACSDEYEGFEETLFIDVNSEEMKLSKYDVQNLIKENFSIDIEPQIIVLTHWS